MGKLIYSLNVSLDGSAGSMCQVKFVFTPPPPSRTTRPFGISGACAPASKALAVATSLASIRGTQ